MNISRRGFLGRIALAGAAGRFPAAAYPPIRRPNIVLVLADDAGWNDVGYHNPEILSPNIDRLAREGVQLDNFHVYATCSPTRAALLTGRPPTRFGIRGPLQYRGDRGLPEGTPTIASHFRRAGYETSICGKWHLGMRRDLGPHNYGFAHSYGYVGPWLDSYSHLTTDFTGTRDGIEQWHRNGEPLKEEGHVTDLLAAEAVRFIAEKRDKSKPFFLYLPFSAPHTPCQEDARWLEPYQGKIANASRRYLAAAITHMDDAIGRVREAVRRDGIEQETIFVFLSDNGGPRGGDNTRWLIPPRQFYMSYGATDVLSDNRPWRGGKGQFYEGGIRVPAVVHWPGRLEAGKLNAPMLVCDLWPTLAASAGAELAPGSGLEGVNLWPVITGRAAAGDRIMYWSDGRNQALRQGGWKLLHFGDSLEGGRFELYDVEKDPYETSDQSQTRPEIANRLKAELSRQMARDVS